MIDPPPERIASSQTNEGRTRIMAERYWFIRARGRVLGPFTMAQLDAMRARGQFTRFYEISEDRLNWESASTLTHLFASPDPQPGAGSRRGEPLDYAIDDVGTPVPGAPVKEVASWYYAVGDRQEGPIPFDELQRKVERGEIQAQTLVWKAGMAEWSPARTVGGLIFPGAAPNPSASHPQSGFAPYPTRTSGMAIASMVLGILWLCGLGSLLATIFGGVALAEINRSKGAVGGRGMAVTGLVLGILGLALWGLAFLNGFMHGFLNALNRPQF